MLDMFRLLNADKDGFFDFLIREIRIQQIEYVSLTIRSVVFLYPEQNIPELLKNQPSP